MTSYFHDAVRIGYIENTGAFLGFGGVLPENLRFLLFTVLVAVLLMCLFLYLIFSSMLNTIPIIGFSLILGGGASNLYDRLVNAGAVVDFLNLGIGPVRTGVFNMADMAIMTGVALVLLAYTNIWQLFRDNK